MELPNLLGIGVQKAGTSSLYSILQKHPEIAVSHTNETHFFEVERLFKRGLKWYKKQFPNVTSEKYLFEITPEYIYSEKALRRIHDLLGTEIKFILMLRHPVDRSYSHYNMNKMAGFEKRTFNKAMEEEYTSGGDMRYISKSLYGNQIANFLKYFSIEDLHIILFDEFIADQNKSLRGLWKFLKVKPLILDKQVHRNQSGLVKFNFLRWIYKTNPIIDSIKNILHKFPKLRRYVKSILEDKPEKITSQEREEYFYEYFYDDIKYLEKLTDTKFNIWYSKQSMNLK